MKQNIQDPLFVETVCENVPAAKRHYCIEGMISYLIVHEAESSAGAVVCPLLHVDNRAACERAVLQAQAFYPE